MLGQRVPPRQRYHRVCINCQFDSESLSVPTARDAHTKAAPFIRLVHCHSPSGAAHFEVCFAAALEACPFIEAQGCFTLRTCRQMNLIAISTRGEIKSVRKNLSTQPKLSVCCVGDHIFNHPIRSTAARQVRHNGESARRGEQICCLRDNHGHEAGSNQGRPNALGCCRLRLSLMRMKVLIKFQYRR